MSTHYPITIYVNIKEKIKTANFRSGFVTIIGRPNVGKSTLLNRFCDEKVAIVTSKPQTTRGVIRAIYHDEDMQIIFVDTPGFNKSAHKLGGLMNEAAGSVLSDYDIALFLVAPKRPTRDDEEVLGRLKKSNRPVFLVINKIDTVEKSALLPVISAYDALFPFTETFLISALKGAGTEDLMSSIKSLMPTGPKYYPDDMITDQTEREIVSELIREQALRLLEEEVPHGLAVEIMSMKKRPSRDLIDIEATIYCEKQSHKGIIIGKNGAMLKDIGSRSRIGIERFLGTPVNIGLWVKVKEGWRDSDFLLRSFGFK